nr:chemotaxis protein CheW [uncultured Anaeromusa sp.]
MANHQLVVFELDGEEYGINALTVNGILRPKKFSLHKMPGLPPMIEGVIDLRGQINYIFNLGIKLKLDKTIITEDSKFVMVNVRDTIMGCIVDEVTDIVIVSDEQIQAQPSFIADANGNYVDGVAKLEDRLIIILKPECLFSVEEIPKEVLQ